MPAQFHLSFIRGGPPPIALQPLVLNCFHQRAVASDFPGVHHLFEDVIGLRDSVFSRMQFEEDAWSEDKRPLRIPKPCVGALKLRTDVPPCCKAVLLT